MTPSFQAKEQLDFNFPLKAIWPQPSTPPPPPLHPNPAAATPRATIEVCAKFVFQGCVTWHAFVCEIYIFLKGRSVSEEWTSAVGVLRACTHIKRRIDWNILQKCLATSCSTFKAAVEQKNVDWHSRLQRLSTKTFECQSKNGRKRSRVSKYKSEPKSISDVYSVP